LQGQTNLTKSKRIDRTIYNILDTNSGQLFSFDKVERYLDGTVMDDSKCDYVIYIKVKDEYFKRNYSGGLDIRWFGCNDSRPDNQIALNQILLKYKSAYIPAGVYNISEPINVPAGSVLHGEGKSSVIKLVSLKPVDALRIHRGVHLRSFKIDCSKTNMNLSSAILVNAWEEVQSIAGELKLQDLILVGNYPHLQGVGLKLQITQDSTKKYSLIAFCKFLDMDIYGFRDGIFCDLEYNKGDKISFINANIFDNIIIYNCLRPVRLINSASKSDIISGKSTISFNYFRSIVIQHAVGEYPAFSIDGAAHNKYESQIIDWRGQHVEQTKKSSDNIFETIPHIPSKLHY
jgi:hypothetical protein